MGKAQNGGRACRPSLELNERRSSAGLIADFPRLARGGQRKSSGRARERCPPAEPFVHMHHQAHGEERRREIDNRD